MKRPNHSYIPDIKRPNFKKFSKFKEAVQYKVTLNPGNVLFIPSGWWHQVESLNPSISLNFWWNPKISECEASHVLRYRLGEAFKENKFSEINGWLDLGEFNSYLNIAQYLSEKDYRWASLIFCGAYARENLSFFSDFKEPENLNNFEAYLYKLVDTALKEDDNLLKNCNVNEVILSLKNQQSLEGPK